MINKLIESNLSRFLLSGGVTFVCEYVIFYLLFAILSWNLLIANSVSFGVGLAVNFLLNRQWAFKKATFQRKTQHQVGMYVMLAIINLLLTNLIVSGLNEVGLDPRIGKIVAIVLIAISNYYIYRRLIFSGETSGRDG